MPAHGRRGVWGFDEKVAGPTVEVGAEHALDEVVDLGVHADVLEVGAGLVPFADVLGGLAGFEQREQLGQVGVDGGHLLAGVDGRQIEQVALLTVESLLGGSKGRGRHGMMMG